MTDVTREQKLEAMVGEYQQMLANEQLKNANLTVDKRFVEQENQLLKQELQELKGSQSKPATAKARGSQQ
ncbi:hypothetical protein SEA_DANIELLEIGNACE_30 [Arthrobacter phage DanielleIgnace]|nr:hypothetical protein SEA_DANIELLEIGNACE_30 [Arthrobacter phage DanielleIgnace]